MSISISIKRQKNIENIKRCIINAFKENLISSLIVLDYPKWSIYYKNESDDTATHSFHYNSIDAGIIHKFLRENYL